MHRNSFLEPGWGAQGSVRRAWQLHTPQLERVEGLGAAGHVFVGVSMRVCAHWSPPLSGASGEPSSRAQPRVSSLTQFPSLACFYLFSSPWILGRHRLWGEPACQPPFLALLITCGGGAVSCLSLLQRVSSKWVETSGPSKNTY